jgi:hypothetical protein
VRYAIIGAPLNLESRVKHQMADHEPAAHGKPSGRWWRRFLRHLAGHGEAYTAFLSLIVSVVAIWLGIRSDSRSQLHDRLSVWPVVQKSIQMDKEDPERLSIVLANKGMGPARLVTIRLFVDGYEGEQDPETDHWFEKLYKLGATGTFKMRAEAVDDYVLAPNDELRPIGFQPNEPGQSLRSPDRNAIRHLLSKVHVDYCYCSIYDECWRVEELKRVGVPSCEPFLSKFR